MKRLILILFFLAICFCAFSQPMQPRGTFTGGTLASDLIMSNGTLIDVATYVFRLKSDPDTYCYSNGPNSLRFTCGSTDVLRIDPLLAGFWTSGGFSAYLSQTYEMFFVGAANLNVGAYANGYPMIYARGGVMTSTRPGYTALGDSDTGVSVPGGGVVYLVSDGFTAMTVASSGATIHVPLSLTYYTASSTTPVATTTYSTGGATYATGSLIVDIGGILQSGDGIDYTETSSTMITFGTIIATGTRVTLRWR